MTTVFGLPNCDSCKKARKWLDQHGIVYDFKHVRDQPPQSDTLSGWLETVGWETLLNRRSTTWRTLEDSEKEDLTQGKVRKLMQENPTLIKRPVTVSKDAILVGFKAKTFEDHFLE